MIRLFLVTGLCIAFFVETGMAQDASAVWALTSSVNSTSIGGAVTANAEVFTADLTVYGYSGQTGPLGSAMQLMTTTDASKTWPNESAYNGNRHIEFSISPAANNNLIVDTVSVSLGGKGGSNMRAELFYSTNGFTDSTQLNSATLSLTKDSYTTFTYGGIGAAVANGKSFSLRIYPWYKGGATGKYIALQNVVVKGSTIAIPVSASAVWPLLSNGSANISGLVQADDIVFDGTNLFHYGYAGSGDQWSNHLPSDGAWPAETSPNDSRYAQFAAVPQIGATMYIDSITFIQSSSAASSLRVAVYSSEDSTFTIRKLIADTSISAAAALYSFPISQDTISTKGKYYIRFYPYSTTGEKAPTWITMDSVGIYGRTTGSLVVTPTLTTASASYISASFFTTGGTITSDGGSTVTARGVCWNTSGSPTLSDSFLVSGSGVGSFTCSVTDLAAGTTYYLRSYATNIAGTSYGTEISVKTLSSVVSPTVTTTAVSSIMAVTAKSGGNATAWGGASITAKGICWNSDTTISYPTVADSKTIDGTDVGSFSSALSGLLPNTKYFIRAYAVNSAGTGYGTLIAFTTQMKSPDTTVVVAKDGSGNYTTIGAAFRDVPSNYTGTWTIFVRKGNYHEKDTLASGKVNVVLLGEDRDSTLLWNFNYSDDPAISKAGTASTYTVTLDADDFIAKNMTFENTYYPNRWGTTSNTQAVAVSTNGDRQQFYNCAFNGYQDTYYTRGSAAAGRAYHKNCIFKGTVDYVFGRNICVFDSCTFMTIRAAGTITAGATDASSLYGYIFRNCTLLGDTVASTDSTGYARSVISASNGWLLGRPWQSAPRTVFIHCYEAANIAAAGWTTMSVNPALYTEYRCWGPGAAASRSVIWSATEQPSVMTSTDASNYSLSKIFARSSASSSLILYDWYPSLAAADEDMNFTSTGVEKTTASVTPRTLRIGNYPNPFNPETNIQFTVAASGKAVVKIYNILGRELACLFNGQALSGQEYKVAFNASKYSSGVYFCIIRSDGHQMVSRMLLLK